MNDTDVDLAILVALPEEFGQLIADVYGSLDIHRDPEYGNYYYRFCLPSERYAPVETVACFIGGMGPDRSSRQMERLLQKWRPRITAVIGICGAIHRDVSLGDVIVPSRVDAYLATTKAVPAAEGHFNFEHRGTEYECDHEIVEEARHLRFAHRHLYERWQSECAAKASKLLAGHVDELARKGLLPNRPSVHTGRMASGPVIGAAASFSAWLRERSADCAAIEMEAAGVAASAAERVTRARFIAVRGVSDLADERKSGFDGVRAGSIRTLAMSNALGFIGALAGHGTFSPRSYMLGSAVPIAGSDVQVHRAGEEDLINILVTWMLTPLSSGENLSGICALFVDDERVCTETIGLIVKQHGAESLSARDGNEALRLLASRDDINLVVTDLIMPNMDGFALLRAIAEKWPTLPAVVFSGYAFEGRTYEGCVAVFQKPTHYIDLLRLLADISRDRVRQALMVAVPELRKCFHLLFNCRMEIASFMDSFNGTGVFESAFRHKLKDSVTSFARAVIRGANPKLETYKLTHQVRKLDSLLRAAQIGASPALVEFFEMFAKDTRKQAKEIELALDLDPASASGLENDAKVLICIALIELVDNAMEALSGKGTIRVVLSRLEIRRCVLLQVCSQTGPLSEVLAERIFEEGYSTKGPERGLGLSILRRLAERFGGSLELSQNDGVEFCMKLPSPRRGH